MKKAKWTGKKIRVLRELLGLTQKDFAARLGVTQNYVYMIEAGRNVPGETLKLLLDCVERGK